MAPDYKGIRALKSKLQKLFARHWETSIMSDGKSKSPHGRKLRTYRKFKYLFGREPYLALNMNPSWRVSLTRFRVSAHRLMIEQGRHSGIELGKRLCTKCSLGIVEDEWHFLFICPYYTQLRNKLMQTIMCKSPLFNQLHLDDQLCWVMSNHDPEIALALAEFIYSAMCLRFPK